MARGPGSGPDPLGRHSQSECLRPKAALLAILAVVLCGGCQERGRPDPGIAMAVSHEREPAAGGAGEKPRDPTRLVVPPAAAHTYSAIPLTREDSGGGRGG